MNQDSQNWMDEFQEFMWAQPLEPPDGISHKLLGRVRQSLNPSPIKVFTKLAFVHLVVGGFTLLFCPQFGVGLLNGMGLMAIFMHFGPVVCMISCGAFLLSASMFAAAILLRPEEIKILRKGTLFHVAALAALSMALLICARADIALGLGAVWLLGSVIGGTSTLELGWVIRRHRMG